MVKNYFLPLPLLVFLTVFPFAVCLKMAAGKTMAGCVLPDG